MLYSRILSVILPDFTLHTSDIKVTRFNDIDDLQGNITDIAMLTALEKAVALLQFKVDH